MKDVGSASLAWCKQTRPPAAWQAHRIAHASSLRADDRPIESPIITQVQFCTPYIRKASPDSEIIKDLSPVNSTFASVRQDRANFGQPAAVTNEPP